MYIEAPHIQEMIGRGEAKVLPEEISRAAGKFVDSLEWQPPGSRLDADKIAGSRTCDWMHLTDDELLAWARKLSIAAHEFVVVLYSSEEPSLVCDFETAIRNIDVLFWRAPGTRFLFGADRSNDAYLPVFSHFIEYDGRGRLLGKAAFAQK